MSDFPILLVAGFGRCGTTMVMTMLDRGGFPVAGPRPAYEVSEMRPSGRVDAAWLQAQAGHAVKWIDPLNALISRNDMTCAPVVIHMTRGTREMAASQVKIAAAFMGVPNDRRTRRAFEKDIAAKEMTLRAHLDHTGTVYSMSFEWVLAQPAQAAEKLTAIIAAEFGKPFDAAAAAAVVLPRSPLCAPDLSIEMGMVS